MSPKPRSPSVPGFPYTALDQPLPDATRARIRFHLSELLRWQQGLKHWPGVMKSAPDATPFVSLYARGRLVGCYGSSEGAPGERLIRAFLLALADTRGGGIRPDARGELSAQVSFPRAVRSVRVDEAAEVLEPGTHGVVLTRENGAVFPLLPWVARERRTHARGMLDVVARKAGLEPGGWQNAGLVLFETDDVSVHASESNHRGRSESLRESAEKQAARWLAARVDRDGAMEFEIDAHTGAVQTRGEGYHARVAIGLRALRAQGEFRAATKRLEQWLRSEITRGLAGRAMVPDWPGERARVAGVLALAVRASACEREVLRDYVTSHAGELTRAPWYAAQAVSVLGRNIPAGVWDACVADLSTRPFAPWTLLAARAIGDGNTRERCERALCASIAATGVHVGGARATEIPEVALTAAAVEALAGSESAEAMAAMARARAWLKRWQWVRGRVPASMDPALATGAFPASPVNDRLRCDVTGHALLGLLGK